MDTMRGNFGSFAEPDSDDPAEIDAGPATLRDTIGNDERRMQVRAYNHWASLLGDRNFPAAEDLEPENLPDFGPYSVLLDFTNGIENPGISYLGAKLAEECDVSGEELQTLSDVPARSLLTRITDHYMQILANQAPIGFEAEFVNQRGATILYRGILLPFSSDDDTIDFIYGVINWKELGDAQGADELLLEIDQALEAAPTIAPHYEEEAPLTDWADGPGAVPANDLVDPSANEAEAEAEAEGAVDNVLPLPSFGYDEEETDDEAEPEAAFELETEAHDEGDYDEAAEDEEEPVDGPAYGSLLRMPLEVPKGSEKVALALSDLDPAEIAFDEPEPLDLAIPELDPAVLDPAEMGLADWLAAARELAAAAHTSEDRTRNALYEAIGRAYDFSLAATQAPDEFHDLLADSSLTMQDRAPMTPVVKLVFGADYDKTRLTEYAAALSHAHRLALPFGTLGAFLGEHDGGLKGVVKAERRLRKEEAGKAVEPLDAPRLALARKLRALPTQSFDAIAAEGSEFALVMIRRTESGEIVVLGEVPDDVALVERAARRLLG